MSMKEEEWPKDQSMGNNKQRQPVLGTRHTGLGN